jgi:hypothetical protein
VAADRGAGGHPVLSVGVPDVPERGRQFHVDAAGVPGAGGVALERPLRWPSALRDAAVPAQETLRRQTRPAAAPLQKAQARL